MNEHKVQFKFPFLAAKGEKFGRRAVVETL